MFERYAGGDSMKRVAKDRNRDGISSPQPQKGRVARSWAQWSVRHILRNEISRRSFLVRRKKSVRLKRASASTNADRRASRVSAPLERSGEASAVTQMRKLHILLSRAAKARTNLNSGVITARESPTLRHRSRGSHRAWINALDRL